jgi:hypothetical protein
MVITGNGFGRRAEAAYENLRQRLTDPRQPVGERLPPERELAIELGISRSTLRKAIARLVADGVIYAKHGSGTYTDPDLPRDGRTATISIMADLAPDEASILINAALLRGHLISLYSQSRVQWDSAQERSFLAMVGAQRHRGLLAFCSPNSASSQSDLAELERSGVRVLHIEHGRVARPTQGHLLPDFTRAGQMAVEHLAAAGYRRIVVIGLNATGAPYIEMQRLGIMHAAGRLGLPVDGFDMPAWTGEENTRLAFAALSAQIVDGSGIIAMTYANGLTLRTRLRHLGRMDDGRLGLIGISVVAPERYGTPLDRSLDILDFDRFGTLLRAIELITAMNWQPPQELIAPRLLLAEPAPLLAHSQS